MGLLIDGQWRDDSAQKKAPDGSFVRQKQAFRSWITPSGEDGPGGVAAQAAQAGRYHLYVGLACPWAHRALIMRRLKGLEALIDVSSVHWLMGDEGWTFETDGGPAAGDPLFNCKRLYQLYQKAAPNFTGRVTVPVLWDKQENKIVNNESADIVRIFNTGFDELGATPGDYYPPAMRDSIDAINERVYDTVNNGVYKSGFATTQSAYNAAVVPLFESLDWLEGILSTQRYLTGDNITEADIRLFTTLIRFDMVYVGHFKCNIRRIVDYPSLWAYTRELYQHPAIRPTVDFEHIKKHYHASHESINPHRIIPAGPALDFDAPHGRG
ncbi:MAG: glutathione S-transferase family protein [Burkholderiaceae bacterium]